jgi:hypothetical protein
MALALERRDTALQICDTQVASSFSAILTRFFTGHQSKDRNEAIWLSLQSTAIRFPDALISWALSGCGSKESCIEYAMFMLQVTMNWKHPVTYRNHIFELLRSTGSGLLEVNNYLEFMKGKLVRKFWFYKTDIWLAVERKREVPTIHTNAKVYELGSIEGLKSDTDRLLNRMPKEGNILLTVPNNNSCMAAISIFFEYDVGKALAQEFNPKQQSELQQTLGKRKRSVCG